MTTLVIIGRAQEKFCVRSRVTPNHPCAFASSTNRAWRTEITLRALWNFLHLKNTSSNSFGRWMALPSAVSRGLDKEGGASIDGRGATATAFAR